MKKKILLVLGSLAILTVVAAGYLFLRKPAQVRPSSIKVVLTPERIARGKYIFESVADCSGCHSQRDFSLIGGPVVDSGRGAGANLSEIYGGLPGTVVASNLTPDPETGIGLWSDGEKIRAIRDGVGREGNALFPMMPYEAFRHMSDDDVQAVVAYLNSLPPVKHSLPKTSLPLLPALTIKSVPSPAGAVASPSFGDLRQYGEYLVTLGGCQDCHTPSDSHGQIPGRAFSGGTKFDSPLGHVVSANITPDLETGIGKWSAEFFQKKFYDYREYAQNGSPKLPGPEAFTFMPWLGFSQKTAADLDAIYTYLKTLPAVHNAVETHPATPTKAPALP